MCLTTRSLQTANLSFQTEKNKPRHGLSTRFKHLPLKKKAASSFPLIGITSTFRSNQSTFHTITPNVNYGITDRHFAQLVEQRRLADEGKYPVTTESSPMESNSKKPTESASNKFFAIGYCGSKIKHYLCCTNVVQNGRGLSGQRKRRFCKMLKAKHLRSLR